MQRLIPALGALVLLLAPLGAGAADLVVWWEKGFYPQEDQALREIIAAFEQKTGKQVELAQVGFDDTQARIQAALAAGQPPDFIFPYVSERLIPEWAHDDLLADLGAPVGPLLDLFDPDAVDESRLLDGVTGRRDLYALPMGRYSNNIHV